MFFVEMYEDYIDEALADLKDLVETGSYNDDKNFNFINIHDLESELSHNDISLLQADFVEKAKVYLKTNHPGKFVLHTDWVVHLCTTKFFKEHVSDTILRYEIC